MRAWNNSLRFSSHYYWARRAQPGSSLGPILLRGGGGYLTAHTLNPTPPPPKEGFGHPKPLPPHPKHVPHGLWGCSGVGSRFLTPNPTLPTPQKVGLYGKKHTPYPRESGGKNQVPHPNQVQVWGPGTVRFEFNALTLPDKGYSC